LGHDLDYREDAFKMALEGMGDFPAPSFLGVIDVYYEGQGPIIGAMPVNWEPI